MIFATPRAGDYFSKEAQIWFAEAILKQLREAQDTVNVAAGDTITVEVGKDCGSATIWFPRIVEKPDGSFEVLPL